MDKCFLNKWRKRNRFILVYLYWIYNLFVLKSFFFYRNLCNRTRRNNKKISLLTELFCINDIINNKFVRYFVIWFVINTKKAFLKVFYENHKVIIGKMILIDLDNILKGRRKRYSFFSKKVLEFLCWIQFILNFGKI